MINYLTRLKIADNCGAREVQCIKILKGGYSNNAILGKLIVVVIKRINFKIKRIVRGAIFRALIVRTKYIFFRGCGIWLKFGQNAAILINKRLAPKGKRLFGPMLKEICIQYNFLGTITRFIL